MGLMALWWWIDRWRKSTAYTDMTLEEQGAYRNLLDEAHLRGGAIPNDERILGKACGDALAWTRVRPAVLAHFDLQPDGWHNETLEAVLRESTLRADRQARYRARRSSLVLESETETETDPEIRDGDGDGERMLLRPQLRETLRQPLRSGPTGSGVMAGMLPRDHLNCRPPCVRICLSAKQHALLRARFGGDEATADTALDAFYVEVRDRLPNIPIGDKPWDFWEAQFRAKFGTVATTTSKTAGNAAAGARFLARGKT